jgi:glutaredoxin
VTPPLPQLVLYGRPGCHLCDDAQATLDALLRDRARRGLPAPSIRTVSIDDDPELQRRYAFTIPVVVLADREVELATSPARLRALLAEVLDHPEPVT